MTRGADVSERVASGGDAQSGAAAARTWRGPEDCTSQCLVLDAVAGLGVGLVLLDVRGTVLWLNRTAEELLGVAAAECVRRPLALALRDPRLCAFWQDHEAAGQSGFAELSVRWPQPMELKLHLADCRGRDGNLRGRALLVCNVTHERQAQVELSRAVAERLLALTSGHMPPEPVANLTSQELRVLRLVGRGLSNEEIAQRTSISASTVRSHLKHLYRKLHLHSRAEAVSFAARNHLS
jgi:DNA-binding CsgD family transcriptional regulator